MSAILLGVCLRNHSQSSGHWQCSFSEPAWQWSFSIIWLPQNNSKKSCALCLMSLAKEQKIGRMLTMQVYRLISCGTVEEKIYRRQVFKGGLSRRGMKEGNPFQYFTQQASDNGLARNVQIRFESMHSNSTHNIQHTETRDPCTLALSGIPTAGMSKE